MSKQVLRDYYKATPWYAAIEREKAMGKGHGEFTEPKRLPKRLVEITADMYRGVCEAWTGKKIWGAPGIEETMESYRKEFLEKELTDNVDVTFSASIGEGPDDPPAPF